MVFFYQISLIQSFNTSFWLEKTFVDLQPTHTHSKGYSYPKAGFKRCVSDIQQTQNRLRFGMANSKYNYLEINFPYTQHESSTKY